MVQSMALDLAGTGITANCIAPGYIDNRVPPAGLDEPEPLTMDQRPSLKPFVPSQRGGVPSDIAKAAVVLCSELGDYINGETVLVDGGLISGGTPD
jgi:3-oxoacyl-[acyl-carrier protein] reductase